MSEQSTARVDVQSDALGSASLGCRMQANKEELTRHDLLWITGASSWGGKNCAQILDFIVHYGGQYHYGGI